MKLLMFLAALFCSLPVGAVTDEELVQLEADMLRYFSTKDRETFVFVTKKLRSASKEAGNERLYYTAWSNLGIYEATQQNYQPALDIAREILDDAHANGSIYGEYAALHTRAMVLLQKQDYDAAEQAFIEAVAFRHRHYPNESAGDDLQELMKIANHRKDPKAGAMYARQIIDEPNVAPIHKGRALFRLSQMAFNKDDVQEFNRIYEEMMLLKQTDGIATLKPVLEVNHAIINGDYQTALRLSDELDVESNAERKALIYHRMGDDAKAYKYMQLFKRVSDSITLVSHGNIVASCYVQMNNSRLQLEQELLLRKNNRLRNRFYASVAALSFMVMLFFIVRGRRLVRQLRHSNKQLVYSRNDAERALNDLNELSFYESKTELTLNQSLNLNKLCNRVSDYAQARCHRGVTMIFQTGFSDDFEMQTDYEALRKLLSHLLSYSARFTHNGSIRLSCVEDGDNVLFSVTDTSAGLGGGSTASIIGMFSDKDNKVRYVGMNFNICQSITRLLHGRIWHDLDYKNGTRFCFELPKVPPMAA